MSLTDMVIMPGADYLDACNAIREKTGGTDSIKSGQLGAQIRGIQTGAKVETCTLTITQADLSTVFVNAYHATVFKDGAFGVAQAAITQAAGTTAILPVTIENVVCGSNVVVTGNFGFVTPGADLVGAEMVASSLFAIYNGESYTNKTGVYNLDFKITAGDGDAASIYVRNG